MDSKTIGWDGISFDIPSKFEVSGIDKRFLQLDNGEQPCIEIRWYEAGKTYKEKHTSVNLLKKLNHLQVLKLNPQSCLVHGKNPLQDTTQRPFIGSLTCPPDVE